MESDCDVGVCVHGVCVLYICMVYVAPSRAESIDRNGLLLLILLLLRVFVVDDRSHKIDIIINSNYRNAQRH